MLKIDRRPTQQNRARYDETSQTLAVLWGRFRGRPDARQILENLANSSVLSDFYKKTIKEVLLPQYLERRTSFSGSDTMRAVRTLAVIQEALSVSQADLKLITSNPAALETMPVPPDLKDARARLAKLAREYERGLDGDKGRKATEFDIRIMLSKGEDGQSVLAHLEKFLKSNTEVRDPTAAERAKAFGILGSKTFARTSDAIETLRSLLKLDASHDGLTPAQRARAKELVEVFDRQKTAVGAQKVFAVLELEKLLKTSLTETLVDKIVPEIKKTAETGLFEKMLKLADLMQDLKPGDWARYGISQEMRVAAKKLLPILLSAKGKSGAERALLEVKFNRVADSNFGATYKLADTLSRFAKVAEWGAFKKIDQLAGLLGGAKEALKLLYGTNPVPAEVSAFIEKFLSLKSKIAPGAPNRLAALAQMRELLLSPAAKTVSAIVASNPLASSSDASVILRNTEALAEMLKSGSLTAEEKAVVEKLLQRLSSLRPLMAGKTGPSQSILNGLRTIIAVSLAGDSEIGKKIGDLLRSLETYTERQGDRKVDAFEKAADLFLKSDDANLRKLGEYLTKLKTAKSTVAKNMYRMLASDILNNTNFSKPSSDLLEKLSIIHEGVFARFLALKSVSPIDDYAQLARLMEAFRTGGSKKTVDPALQGDSLFWGQGFRTGGSKRTVDPAEVLAKLDQFKFEGETGLAAIKNASYSASLFNEMLAEFQSENPETKKFDGLQLIKELNKKGEWQYKDPTKEGMQTYRGTLSDFLKTLLVLRLKQSDRTFATPDGKTLSTKDYVQLIELKALLDSGWNIGNKKIGDGKPTRAPGGGWRIKGRFNGTISADWIKNNLIDKTKVEERLKLYESNSEFQKFIRETQKAVRTEQAATIPALDTANIYAFVPLLKSRQFAEWLVEKGADGKPIPERSQLAAAMLSAINMVDPEQGRAALKKLTENQVSIEADLAFTAKPSEEKVRSAALDLLEAFSDVFRFIGTGALVTGGLGAADWGMFKAIMASFVSKGSWKRGDTIQDVMAEFSKEVARHGVVDAQAKEFKEFFQYHWKTGSFHVYLAQPANLLAGILGMVVGETAWDRVAAAQNLLDAVSWSHYFVQKVAFKKTRPNESKSILNMVAADRGQMGTRLFANAPEWLKVSKKVKQSASATAVNALVSNLSSPTLTFKSTIAAAVTKSMDAVIDSFVEASIALEIERELLARLKAEAAAHPEDATLKAGIVKSEEKIAALVTKQDEMKTALAEMGMGRIGADGLKKVSANARKKIDDFFNQLRSKINPEMSPSEMKADITAAINAKRLEIVKSTLVDAGMSAKSPDLDTIAKRLLSDEGYKLFQKDNRAFLLDEISRSSVNAAAVAQYDKISVALADWTATDIIAGVKKVNGKLLNIEDVLTSAGLSFSEREAVITTLELTAGKMLKENPSALLFSVRDAGLRTALKDWTFEDLKAGSFTDADGKSWTLKDWLKDTTNLSGESLDNAVEKVESDIKGMQKDIADKGAREPGSNWRYNSNATDYFDVMKELDDPDLSGRVSDLIDDVRIAKFNVWADKTFELIQDTKMSDLKDGKVRIVNADGGESFSSLKSQLIKSGMSEADADVMSARIRVLAAAEAAQDATPTKWISNIPSSSSAAAPSGSEAIRRKWGDFAELGEAKRQAIFNSFDDATKKMVLESSEKAFAFDTKLAANKVSALFSSSGDIVKQTAASTGVSRKLLTGLLFRNVLESMGVVASIVDLVLSTKDMIGAVKKKDAWSGVIAGISLTSAVVGLAGGLAIFSAGAVFAMAVPLAIIGIGLGLSALMLTFVLMDGKSNKAARKAYEKAIESYSPEYLQAGGLERLREYLKKIAGDRAPA